MAFLPPPPPPRWTRQQVAATGVPPRRAGGAAAGGRRLPGTAVTVCAAAAGHPHPDGPPPRAQAAIPRGVAAFSDDPSVSRRSPPPPPAVPAADAAADGAADAAAAAAVDYLCPEGHYWDWSGGRVHYVTAGTAGPPVLMLPGFGVGTFHWEDNLVDLARDHRVFCMDKLGLGRSLPAPPQPDAEAAAGKAAAASDVATAALPPLGVDLWAVQVTAFVESVIGEPVYLAGNSLGGLVALTAAAARPDLVRGVVLLNAAPFFGALPHPATSPRLHAAITVPLRSSGVARWVLARFWSNLRHPPTLTRLLRLVYATPARVTDTLVDQILAPTRVDGAFGRFAAMLLSSRGERGFDDALDVVAAAGVPLAMINGREDVWVVPAWGHRVKRRAPETAYFELSPAGHCPHAEAPAAVNAVLRAWVAAVEGGGELPMREVDAATGAPAAATDGDGSDDDHDGGGGGGGGGGGDGGAPALGPDTEHAVFDGVSVRRLTGRPRGWLERLMTRSVIATFIASSLQTLADHPEISQLDIGGW